jgi:hypothetical protein
MYLGSKISHFYLKDLLDTITVIDAIVKIVEWSCAAFKLFVKRFLAECTEWEDGYKAYMAFLKKTNLPIQFK